MTFVGLFSFEVQNALSPLQNAMQRLGYLAEFLGIDL